MQAIILAAGCSSRLGKNKQLVEIGGHALVARCVSRVLDAGLAKVIVVTGFERERVAAALKGIPCDTAHNSLWSTGMGTSIQAGLAAACAGGEPDAVLIALPDQVEVTTAHFQALLARINLTPHAIVATQYAQTVGVPALFKRQIFEGLRGLSPNAGAKALMATHSVDAIIHEPAAIDLDTPDDLARLGI